MGTAVVCVKAPQTALLKPQKDARASSRIRPLHTLAYSSIARKKQLEIAFAH